MSLCTVSELRAALGIGALYSDALLQEVCDAGDAVLLPMLWVNKDYNIAHSRDNGTGTLYFDHPVQDIYYVGQTVNVAGNQEHFNGNKTITAVGEYSISFALNGQPADAPRHPVIPYGTVTGDVYVDWAQDAAVQQAATMICIDIWQARNAAGMGSVGIDGTPMPYRLGNTLLGKVRGLIAHALAPGGLVG